MRKLLALVLAAAYVWLVVIPVVDAVRYLLEEESS